MAIPDQPSCEDRPYQHPSMPMQRLSFVAEDDAAAGGSIESASGVCRTASQGALARWDESSMRRSSAHDILEALLSGGSPLAGGAPLRAYPDLLGFDSAGGAAATGASATQLHGASIGLAATAGPSSLFAQQGTAMRNDAPALLTAAHALAGLLNADPAATPALLPMLAATDLSVGRQVAHEVSGLH